MGETAEGPGARRGRRARGGAEARGAARRGGGLVQLRYIPRAIPVFEALNEDGLALIEANA